MKITGKRNALWSILLCITLLAGLLPTVAFAAEPPAVTGEAPTGETTSAEPGFGKVMLNGKVYDTLREAVTAAVSGDTIVLGEGNYTLYGIKSDNTTKNKDLTFVGQGADKTAWNIGAEVPDPANFGTEYNSDYSFKNAGTVTFQNMTLRSGEKHPTDYLGFSHTTVTIVKDCVINGTTAYWGYASATFTNTTFNCPPGEYALWAYCSETMTFNSCTFNSKGKTINVYNEGAEKNITVNFENCTVNSTSSNKAVLNINDTYANKKGDYKFYLNFKGNNVISDGSEVHRNTATCSRWFGFSKDANNTGCTVVTIDGTTVFAKGKTGKGEMVGHELIKGKYTDGYVDNAYDITYGEWVKADDGKSFTRTFTKICDYCGDKEEGTETGYSVTYTDGAEGKVFKPQTKIAPKGGAVPAFNGTPKRDDYTFKGWTPAAADSVTENVTYTAVWEKNEKPEKPEKPVQPGKPARPNRPAETTTANGDSITSPETGDSAEMSLWTTLLLVSAAAIATVVIRTKKYYR